MNCMFDYFLSATLIEVQMHADCVSIQRDKPLNEG